MPYYLTININQLLLKPEVYDNRTFFLSVGILGEYLDPRGMSDRGLEKTA
jgi:hypothetical protein